MASLELAVRAAERTVAPKPSNKSLQAAWSPCSQESTRHKSSACNPSKTSSIAESGGRLSLSKYFATEPRSLGVNDATSSERGFAARASSRLAPARIKDSRLSASGLTLYSSLPDHP